MSRTLLAEYRCTCGKLLFKGLLSQGLVEVKCRRCAAVSMWGLTDTPQCAFVESGTDARVTAASENVPGLFGYDRDYLIGRPITDVFPLLRDAPSPCDGSGYTFMPMPLVLRDGTELEVESCVVPKYQGGAFAGYRVFSAPHYIPFKNP